MTIDLRSLSAFARNCLTAFLELARPQPQPDLADLAELDACHYVQDMAWCGRWDR